MTQTEILRSKANSLPECAGVYIMKDADGEIIYVGKSKKLKNRVTSYFSGAPKTPKTAKMVSRVRDFEYILCKTEMEALTLENVLIKKHSPKYNIKLKDAKSYPYIKITAEEYPKLFVTRERHSDRARYFGPYQGMSSAYSALETVKKIFTLPTCKRSFPRDIKKERPCIYRDMGRCIAPCAGGVSAEEYGYLVKQAAHVLDGNVKEAVGQLEKKMLAAAEELDFERAAAYRDSIAALRSLSEKQKVVDDAKINRDIFALYTSPTMGVLATLSVREGALIGKNEFLLSSEEPCSPEDMIGVILSYYEGGITVPREVLIDFPAEAQDMELLAECLSELSGHKITVRHPERGAARALCDMAYKNAEEAERQYKLTAERENKNLTRLATLLGPDVAPRRIEAYDISNVGDENIVASMVVFIDGKMKRSEYRTFNIKTTDGRDDYGSMREAIGRRLSHIGDTSPSLSEAPDLILLDGGDTHVATVKPLLAERGFDIPVFGMVKDDFHKTRAITDGQREISIATEMNVYNLVYGIQEEAHRFAYLSSQRGKIKSLRRSSLEKIPGIGEKKSRALLAAMTLADIRLATPEELARVEGISERDAKSIYAYFRGESE
ncbi:MAG: excinuclease ABC subunit UvrC [Clostridia bacterium]|nr:excinuclease ABC subunit UvrC [Clostridia bacterium]